MPTKIDREKMKKKIPGWGADLDPANRPGVPKEAPMPGGTGAHWETPEKQTPTVRIFKTKARSELSATFGTTCPPKGLSGLLRRFAYSRPETEIVHWLTLLFADRVDVVETILKDVVTLKAGNPLKQMGLGVELRERPALQRFRKAS